ncbi:MAG: radical SAM protein [Acidobacteriota bacterium]|nr:radical SAM protein [Acidobacteriota bacterium]
MRKPEPYHHFTQDNEYIPRTQNPALMKLALFCEGLRISTEARKALWRGREIMRTRAGLGSGLELVLPGELYVNAPVAEPFSKHSRMELIFEDGGFFISYHDDTMPVALAPRPKWYDRVCSTGKSMRRVGTLQGTYLGIFPTRVCDFWKGSRHDQCRFCSVGLNLGADDAGEKSVTEVMEVVEAAREECGITYVDFNTGHYEDEGYLDALEPYIANVKRETGLLIGVQTPPHHNLDRYRKLRDMGVNRVSFCFEIFDEKRFAQVCPGKFRVYGLERYLDAIDFCARLGPGTLTEPWVANGELIAGLEPPRSTMIAVERLAMVGAVPTVCVFRPLQGTDFADMDPPKTHEMVPIFRHLYETCMRYDLPIGVAPNIHVSLVLLPEECSWLSRRAGTWPYRWKQIKLDFKKKLMGFVFAQHQFNYDHKLGPPVH